MAHVKPMLAVAGGLPTGGGWAYELKWDGVRALVDVADGRLQIASRNENDVTPAYPELAPLADAVEDALLDGEIVAMADGVPSFALLQRRMHVRGKSQAARLAKSIPVTLLVFDVLRLYGVDLTARPYAERRTTLERLALSAERWLVPPVFDDGPATLAAAVEQGLEGVVAKRTDARYRAGQRSPAWVKVKRTRTLDLVVGGVEPGQGGREGSIGALLLGLPGPAGLVYAGQVGSGLSGALIDELAAALTVRPDNPFAGEVDVRTAVWCEPTVVVEVQYSAWTADGRLRHPVLRRLRTDKDVSEVSGEQ